MTRTNLLEAHCPQPELPTLIRGPALDGYAKYFTDESKRAGYATALVFPRSVAEVAGAVRAAADAGMPLTVSGSRTGITAGAVPDGGMAMSLERMNRVLGVRRGRDGEFLLRCEAGVVLADVQRAVRTGRFADAAHWDAASRHALGALREARVFYPPDPTETSATVGGTVACNASGAHTFRYGPTRGYVHALRIVLADGSCLELERGRYHADASGTVELQRPRAPRGTAQIPHYTMPATKNSGGYFAAPGMDLIDLFIGSEGTLGIVVEAELRLIPAPETNCSVVVFCASETAALSFTTRLRRDRDALGLEAIEYFGPNALALMRQRRRQIGAASGVPECLPGTAGAALYLDLGLARDAEHAVLQRLSGLVRNAGADPAECWSAQERDERERLRVFRHALPETVNTLIAEARRTHPDVTKLGTDMAVPDDRLRDVIALYRSQLDAAGLQYLVFGHIGDNHLHVNILPRTDAEYARGKELYLAFAKAVVRMGGSPAAEHGIGKLKTAFLRIMYGDTGVREMRAVKRLFDPELRLGRGTLFE